MPNNREIEEIKNNLIPIINRLIGIIKEEYPELVNIPKELDLTECIHIEATGTISLFVMNKNFYFPIDAFKVLNALRKIPGFGCLPNHKLYTDDSIIINNNTYITYLEHVFLAGLSPQRYFEEILLHETMHFCGSGGGTAIREGINELKTRQIAKKHNLLTSACGYPKETKIALILEEIFGEKILNQIAFSHSQQGIKHILDKVSLNAAEFYFKLEQVMEEEFYHKYMKYNFPGLTGPIKKTKKYGEINYIKAYNLIETYKESQNKVDENELQSIRKK